MVFYKKKGFPKIKEIVLCKVTRILPHSIFVNLSEYEHKEGMIHVSELRNRWTKNIHEIVNIGKQIICRIEKVNSAKGYIDLSKKRVTSSEEKNKKNEIKNENRIEKLIEYVGKKNKITLKEFYNKAGFKIIEEYDSLHNFYENYIENKNLLNEEIKISKKFNEELKEAFDSLIQNSRVNIRKKIKFFANGKDGINNLKKFVGENIKLINKKDNTINISYINSPEYYVTINSKDYKEANEVLTNLLKNMKLLSKKYKISVLE